ncbi:MAG: response regulator [Betaproteobacteria bacterium]|nr:response regulator [Betaproteobacteria bacterium]
MAASLTPPTPPTSGTAQAGRARATGEILVVDDNAANVRLLSDLLAFHGYQVRTAHDGEGCLAAVAEKIPDLILLDVIMPGMDGFSVCRCLRGDPRHQMLPIVLVTSLDPHDERVKGLDAGADDFLSKPIHAPELLARVRSLLRVKYLYEQVQAQARELASWNETLEARVADEVAKNARLARLKRFVSPQLADLIVAGGADDPLKSHRREIAVVFIDLRGFTAFAENTEPERVMSALHEFHTAMGRIVQRHAGTLERFTGDGMMVFFNDPVPIPEPAKRAVEMAREMRDAAGLLAANWRKHGFELGAGIGVAYGFATLGAIGFEDRIDYSAIGTVTNLAARLCSEAPAGEVYLSQRVHAEIDGQFKTESLGAISIRGLSRSQLAYRLLETREPSTS